MYSRGRRTGLIYGSVYRWAQPQQLWQISVPQTNQSTKLHNHNMGSKWAGKFMQMHLRLLPPDSTFSLVSSERIRSTDCPASYQLPLPNMDIGTNALCKKKNDHIFLFCVFLLCISSPKTSSLCLFLKTNLIHSFETYLTSWENIKLSIYYLYLFSSAQFKYNFQVTQCLK